MMQHDNSGPPPMRPPEPKMTTTTHTTTTTVSPAVSLDWIKLDLNYFKTIPGIIKLIQFLLGILCIACGAPARFSGTHFFLFVAVMAFVLTFLWICMYLFCLREGFTIGMPWNILEFYYTAGACAFYCVAMIVQFAETSGSLLSSGKAAAAFGLFNTVAYGFGAFLLFRDWKQNQNQATPANNAAHVP